MVVTKKAATGSGNMGAKALGSMARYGALAGLSLALAAQGFAQSPTRTRAPAAAPNPPPSPASSSADRRRPVRHWPERDDAGQRQPEHASRHGHRER
jgi:peptidyl-prolyl cis-trans isomerase SurA